MRNIERIVAIGLALVLLTAVAPVGAQGSPGGGTVQNVLPTVESFVNEQGGTANKNARDVFSGEIKDRNGEEDIQTLRITVSGPAPAAPTFDVTTVDMATQTTEPADFTLDGWKVWNSGGVRDGVISFKFEYVYAETGTYGFVVDAADTAGFGLPSATITVDVVEAITIAADPVLEDGTTDTGARWGGWSAAPGATLVLSNFLKVTNTGTDDAQKFTVDFNGIDFLGEPDDTWKIGIDGNIEFACAQTLTNEPPSALAFTFAADVTGGVTCTFSGASSGGVGVMYVQYRIKDIPEPMKDQDYGASFTVDAILA